MMAFLHRHRIGSAFAAVLILLAGLVVFYPWRSFFEGRLKSLLEGQGLRNVQLTLSDIGLRTLTIQNLDWGDETERRSSPVLSQLVLDYSLRDLLSGHMKNLSISGVALEVQKEGGVWALQGGLAPISKGTKGASFVFPVEERQIDQVPLERFRLENVRLHLTAGDGSLDLPMLVEGTKKPTPHLSFQSEGLKFKKKDIRLDTGDLIVQADLNFQEKLWSGSWTVSGIKGSMGDMVFSELSGKGTLSAWADRFVLKGSVESSDRLTGVTFQVSYFLSEPQKSEIVINKVFLPWNGGVVSSEDVIWSMGKPQAIKANVKLQNVSLDALLQQLTGKRASASGSISGSLPISFSESGSLLVHDGTLSASGPGTIRMSPEAIPGDNPHVSLVRDVLKNLAYTILVINVRNEPKQGVAIHLSVEGHNPDVYEGRPVRLNVRLGGDVLDFIQQSLPSLTDPRKFLEQSGHAKP